MKLHAELHHVIYALSDALDLVGVDDVAHGKRVGIMAAECGKVMGLPQHEIDFLFELGMLHDIGVSSTQTHHHLVAEFDWVGSQHHAIVGHDLLAGFAPLAPMALPIRYHHTMWNELLKLGLEPAVARQANLIYLVDRVDTLAAAHYADNTLSMHVAGIRDEIQRRSGSNFSPELVEAFLTASRTEAFWLLLEPRAIQSYLQEKLADAERTRASGVALKQVARLFAQIVDAKSPFTVQHSQGVANLARLLAEKMGVDPANYDKIEIAGLLHDLGKLRVPDEILDKPAQLDERERKIINAHSFETFQILRGVEGFEEMAAWAGYHHEEPGGGGYPFHVRGEDLPLEARILRVADIFQAMVQDRPYRAGLGKERALDFMRDLVARGRVDAEIFAVLEASADEAMVAAKPGG
ncbi:MAG TPA: HD domain-containing phosphohydrolase [Gallionella sp.]|nr:HD domain-containing phosphohydrolase [Gallionella sp.]